MTTETRRVELEKMVRYIHECSRKIWLEKKDLLPVVFGVTEDGQNIQVPFDFRSQEEKHMKAAAVAKLFRDKSVLRYVFTSTAWMRQLPKLAKGQDPEKVYEELIKSGEYAKMEKKEILTTAGEDLWGNKLHLFVELKDGKILLETEQVGTEGDFNLFKGII
jgi:hypothetical protein